QGRASAPHVGEVGLRLQQARFSLEHGLVRLLILFFFSSRRRHTRSVSAFLLNRSSDLSVFPARTRKVNANNSAALTGRSTPLIMFSVNSAPSMMRQAV